MAKQAYAQDPGLLGPVSWADVTEGQKASEVPAGRAACDAYNLQPRKNERLHRFLHAESHAASWASGHGRATQVSPSGEPITAPRKPPELPRRSSLTWTWGSARQSHRREGWSRR